MKFGKTLGCFSLVAILAVIGFIVRHTPDELSEDKSAASMTLPDQHKNTELVKKLVDHLNTTGLISITGSKIKGFKYCIEAIRTLASKNLPDAKIINWEKPNVSYLKLRRLTTQELDMIKASRGYAGYSYTNTSDRYIYNDAYCSKAIAAEKKGLKKIEIGYVMRYGNKIPVYRDVEDYFIEPVLAKLVTLWKAEGVLNQQNFIGHLVAKRKYYFGNAAANLLGAFVE